MRRRHFLQTGLSALGWMSVSAAAPRWFARSAAAACDTCFTADRILVVVQMEGGNDGLNTVIPRTDAAYQAARPTLAVPAGSEINLDGLNGLHPRLPRLADWYQKARLGIIHNVGYVNPNLSHFVSTDYYELGVVPGEPIASDGWLARYYDHACAGCTTPDALLMTGAGLSRTPKSMLGSTNYTPPAVGNPASYAFSASSDRDARLAAVAANHGIPTTDEDLAFLQNGYSVAASSIDQVALAAATPQLVAPGTYPAGSLGDGLKLVSQVIRAGFPSKVFYVRQGGYDTHADQVAAASPLTAGAHPTLLDEFDRALDAFLTEMEITGDIDRVVLMTYSEFGRRVAENGSLGTDHGAANCSFVLGAIHPGVYGGQPDLVNLISGSLRHEVDFRSIYAMALEGLFGASVAPVFGQATYDSVIVNDFPKIPFLTRASVAASGMVVR